MDYSLLLWTQRQEEAHRRRLRTYKRNWEYYNGEHKLPLPVRTGQPDDNVIINLVRLVVDKGASYLFGKPVGFELVEGETTPEEEYLRQVWRANRQDSFLLKLAKTGAIYGHCFVKLVPGGLPGDLPRFISLEPENVSVLVDPQDVERALRYRIEWTAEGEDGRPWHYRQDIRLENGRWHIENRRAQGSERWGPDPDRPDFVWEYDWPPVVDCQNLPLPGAYHGLSDIEDLTDQDAINYLASKVQRILRYHAHPKTVVTGAGVQDFKLNEDDIAFLSSPEAAIRNLEMQSDLGSALAFLDRLTTWYLRTTRTPDLNPAQVNVGALSGFALKILYGDALEKCHEKRLTYGDMLIELNRRVLELGGFGGEHITTLHWQDPLPEDEQAEKTRDEFELNFGLTSKETVRARRGLDPAVEAERIAAERREEEVQKGNVGALLVENFFGGREGTEGTQ